MGNPFDKMRGFGRRILGRLAWVPEKEDVEVLEEQGEELEELAGYVQQEFERRQEERRAFELQWRLNQNFLAGNQYCDIDAVLGDVVDVPPVLDWMSMEVFNHIAPINETRLAKLGRVQPGMSVRPATGDNADLMAAKTSTQLLKGLAAAHDLNGTVAEAVSWSEICGTVFLKTVWDKDAGRVIGMVDNEVIREGDLKTVVVPAYEFYPDSVVRSSLKDCQSIIHAKAYTTDEIYRIWGQRIDGRTVDVFTMDNTGVLAGGMGYNPGMATVVKGEMENAEIVLEYMERPSPDLPEGRMVIVAGGRVLHLSELPWQVGEYGERGFPFVRMMCIPNPGYFFGVSVIERLIPIQRDYNAVKNRINDYLARVTTGVLVAEQGTIVNEEIFEDGIAPGTVIEVRNGAAFPKWMEQPPIPQVMLNERKELQEEFNLISGTSEMARNSSAISSQMSGVAIELLKEQDDTRLSKTAEYVRDAVRQLGVIWLRLLRQFVTTQRVTRICGEDRDVQVKLWRGSDLTSDDVVIDTDNELSNTPAQRKNTALELFKAGIYTDPATGQLTRAGRQALMDAFQLGNYEDITNMEDLQRNEAQRENELNTEGTTPVISELDDTEIHVLEHTKYAYSAAFRKLEQDKPEAAQRLLNHIREHKAVQQQMAAQQMAAQNANIDEMARQKLELESMTNEMGG